MINYIKWLFRTKVYKVIDGSVTWLDSEYTSEYSFIIYDGYLGRSWELVGCGERVSPKKLKTFKDVRIALLS